MVFFLDNSHLLGPQVVAPSWSFTDMTPYAFDDTYESSSDDDNTALAISRSIYIVWGNKNKKKTIKIVLKRLTLKHLWNRLLTTNKAIGLMHELSDAMLMPQ